MTSEAANQSPDALADALMELLGEQPEGGEGDPSKEGQQPEAETQEGETSSSEDTPPPAPNADDFDTRYAARRQAEVAQEQRDSRMAELEKLIEEGDNEKVGELFIKEYGQLKANTAISQQVATSQANQIIEGALDKDFVDGLSDEEAVELHGLVQKLDTSKFLSRVIEIKAAKGGATFDEAEVDRRVQEKLQAAQNNQRGNQVRNPSPTSIPNASEKGPPANANNDDLWAAAMEEIAETAQGR